MIGMDTVYIQHFVDMESVGVRCLTRVYALQIYEQKLSTPSETLYFHFMRQNYCWFIISPVL